MNDDLKAIPIVSHEVIKAASDLIYIDSHSFSTRPCQTCKAISTLLKVDFGCVRKAKESK